MSFVFRVSSITPGHHASNLFYLDIPKRVFRLIASLVEDRIEQTQHKDTFDRLLG